MDETATGQVLRPKKSYFKEHLPAFIVGVLLVGAITYIYILRQDVKQVIATANQVNGNMETAVKAINCKILGVAEACK